MNSKHNTVYLIQNYMNNMNIFKVKRNLFIKPNIQVAGLSQLLKSSYSWNFSFK